MKAGDELGGCDDVDRERVQELFAVLDLCHVILPPHKSAKFAVSLGHPIEKVYKGCKKPSRHCSMVMRFCLNRFAS